MASEQNQIAGVIKHVFVLMLENRSFDHMLGFAGLTGTDAVTGQAAKADDLVNNPHFNVDPDNPATQALAASPAELKIYPPDPDPGHEFKNVLMQLCGVNAGYPDPTTKKYPAINNSGFIASYRASGAPDPTKIMKCFSPEQVPVLTTLAREFALCDRWFASMPGPTWPNRFLCTLPPRADSTTVRRVFRMRQPHCSMDTVFKTVRSTIVSMRRGWSGPCSWAMSCHRSLLFMA
ncbi:MAG: alkaline phosphatase family protein [Syntrophorhabdales bacterium]